jgi:hypothetical protein
MTMEEGVTRINTLIIDLEKEPDVVCQPLLKILIEKATEVHDRRQEDINEENLIDEMTILCKKQNLYKN